ncbi:hypothetical protein BDQ12DRAFT_763097 [Crucibulum laeve]|uniref:Fork-head domain-containing protein n=1 Tax=Crucibulum laeve TaxID=68775 RepID=A0A5C3LN59_9AGAR|nr:hypothetical protein BDQ12DRAFT_763097 [Crucibulum laeve]
MSSHVPDFIEHCLFNRFSQYFNDGPYSLPSDNNPLSNRAGHPSEISGYEFHDQPQNTYPGHPSAQQYGHPSRSPDDSYQTSTSPESLTIQLRGEQERGFHPSAFHEIDAGPYLRRQLHIPPEKPINLWALPDPPNGAKPSHSLPVMIKLAIYGSPKQKLTLQEIYQALIDRFEWFRVHQNDNAWKNSIRHNLSLNKVFRLSQRPITEPGKGSYWQLDVSEGEGYKRDRKRRKKTGNQQTNNAEDEGEDDWEDAGSPSNSPSPEADSHFDPALMNQRPGVVRAPSSSRRRSPYPAGGSAGSLGSGSRSSSRQYLSSPVLQDTNYQIDPPPSQAGARFGQTSFPGAASGTYRSSTYPPYSMPGYPPSVSTFQPHLPRDQDMVGQMDDYGGYVSMSSIQPPAYAGDVQFNSGHANFGQYNQPPAPSQSKGKRRG